MQNNIVTDIVNETKAKLAGRLLDLWEFQTRLLKEQLAHKAAVAKAKTFKLVRRAKVKKPAVADCKVIDTRTDQARSRLYFELGNGQVVRADRADDRSVPANILDRIVRGDRRCFRKGKRKAPFKNTVIRTKVSDEVLKNAARG